MRWRLANLDKILEATERERTALIEGFVLAHNIDIGFVVTVGEDSLEVETHPPNPMEKPST